MKYSIVPIIFAALGVTFVGCSDAGVNANSNVQNLNSSGDNETSLIAATGVSKSKDGEIEYCFLQLTGSGLSQDTDLKQVTQVSQVKPLHNKSLSINAIKQISDKRLLGAFDSKPLTVGSGSLSSLQAQIASAGSKASSIGHSCHGSASSVEVSLGLKTEEEHLDFGWRGFFMGFCMGACLLQNGDFGGYPSPYRPADRSYDAPISRPYY